MAEHRVSGRYAKSLVDLAVANKQLDAVKADVDLILGTLKSNRDLFNVLQSPIINSGKKTTIVDAVFKGKVSETTYQFLNLVIEKKREPLLWDICNSFTNLFNTINGIIKVKVTTAVALAEKPKAEIEAYLQKNTGKKIILETAVDPNIIGGLVIRTEDGLYDASISNQLTKIKQTLNKVHIS
ncbi:MAG: ATP synthase F1 subunit delta [Bacteroidota bacterium]|nr:ATP synthase F1 subunit delta [Bacteroidota bacterium]